MATKTLLSLADYGALPEDGKRYELVEGELVELTFPDWKHSSIQAFLLVELGLYLRRNPIGRAGNDFGFVLGRHPDTVLGPDLYFVSNKNAAKVDPRRWMEGAPDLVVEVLSPSNSERGIQRKVVRYLEGGASLIWIVDPEARHVRVVPQIGDDRVLTEADELTAPTLLPGFSVSIRAVLDA